MKNYSLRTKVGSGITAIVIGIMSACNFAPNKNYDALEAKEDIDAFCEPLVKTAVAEECGVVEPSLEASLTPGASQEASGSPAVSGTPEPTIKVTFTPTGEPIVTYTVAPPSATYTAEPSDTPLPTATFTMTPVLPSATPAIKYNLWNVYGPGPGSANKWICGDEVSMETLTCMNMHWGNWEIFGYGKKEGYIGQMNFVFPIMEDGKIKLVHGDSGVLGHPGDFSMYSRSVVTDPNQLVSPIPSAYTQKEWCEIFDIGCPTK